MEENKRSDEMSSVPAVVFSGLGIGVKAVEDEDAVELRDGLTVDFGVAVDVDEIVVVKSIKEK